MKVKIKENEITLHYTMRMYIIYENITGESIDFENMNSAKQLTSLFLACIMASAQKDKIDLKLDYQEFMDFVDDNGGYAILNDFAIWFIDELNNKYSLLKEEKEDDFPKNKRKKVKD